MCQCAAALPILVDFLLLAPVEDYCDSPSLIFLFTSSTLVFLSVCLSLSLPPSTGITGLRINQGHPGSVYQSGIFLLV